MKQLDTQRNAIDNIDRIVNSMEGVWESEAQKVYTDKFRDAKARIERFNDSVAESLDSMRSFVSDCVYADEQTARELRNISW